jgi:hypothetical protein
MYKNDDVPEIKLNIQSKRIECSERKIKGNWTGYPDKNPDILSGLKENPSIVI